MPAHESSDSLLPDNLTVPDSISPEFVQEVGHEQFERLCNRLFELGINHGEEHLFSTFVDGDWMRLYAAAHPVRLSDGSLTPGQRIIVNRASHDLDGSRRMQIDDYLVYFQAESLMHLRSYVDNQQQMDGTSQWLINTNSGPFIVDRSGEVSLNFGVAYKNEQFTRTALRTHDLSLMYDLTHDLDMLSEASRDEIISCQRYQYKNT